MAVGGGLTTGSTTRRNWIWPGRAILVDTHVGDAEGLMDTNVDSED